MNPPQQRVDHDHDHDPDQPDNVRPIGLGAELRAARAAGDPLMRELAEVDGGGGVGELATAYSELAELSAARARALGRAVDAFCGSRQQALDVDRGIVLGMCGHWWQMRVVTMEPVRAVLDWRAADCPHCGRPPAVYVEAGYDYEPEREQA